MRQSRGNRPGLERIISSLSSLGTRLVIAVVISAMLLLAASVGEVSAVPYGIVSAVVVVLFVLSLVGIIMSLAGVDAEAGEIAKAMARDDVQERLLTRWLERARWARTVGGVAGVLIWMFAFQAQADLLVCGAIGILAGAVAAEMHHLRRPGGLRLASLAPRSVADYLANWERNSMAGVAVAASITGLAALLLGRTSSTGWAVVAVLLLGVTCLVQRRVATRARPALPESLRQADDLARRLAVGRGLARPATYAALALVARALYKLEPDVSFAPLLGAGTWLVGVSMWWRNRGLGLDAEQAPRRDVVYT